MFAQCQTLQMTHFSEHILMGKWCMTCVHKRLESRVSERCLYIYVRHSTFHSSQKEEMAQMFINNWGYQQTEIHTYKGISFKGKKKGSSNACYNPMWMKLEVIILSEISQSWKDDFLYDIPRVHKLDKESRIMVTRSWRRREVGVIV